MHQWTFGEILPHSLVWQLIVQQKFAILEDNVENNYEPTASTHSALFAT